MKKKKPEEMERMKKKLHAYNMAVVVVVAAVVVAAAAVVVCVVRVGWLMKLRPRRRPRLVHWARKLPPPVLPPVDSRDVPRARRTVRRTRWNTIYVL